jgi:motility quorum-sensing regulator/GCU-specific mRNA interferase toxin
MEKGTPHCKLPVVKALIEAGQVRATASAFNGARELGINDLAGMCAVVLALNSSNFYKSMTTHADHRVWQDVYRTKTARGDEVYLKLTVIDDVLIVSFKEL